MHNHELKRNWQTCRKMTGGKGITHNHKLNREQTCRKMTGGKGIMHNHKLKRGWHTCRKQS